MAVDEVLLESAAESGRPSLRFYRWSEPTLSLGYFQPLALRAAHRASRDCAVVRRQTGGGAILHDLELTYSLVVPSAHRLAADATRLYITLHEALQSVLDHYDVRAELCAESARLSADDEPFFCFERRAAGDVLVGGSKVCGSAQRRRRGAILQHGSLLFAQSKSAPQLPGILELTGKSLDAADVTERATTEIGRRLRLALEPEGLSAAERDAAARAVSRRYGTADWNARR